MNTDAIREFTLWARQTLTREAEELLLQVYGLKRDGTSFAEKDLPALQRSDDARMTRAKLEKLLADEKDAGIQPKDAVAKLVRETAFTHLNRLVALKLLEARKIIRGAIDRHTESNGFKMYLAEHDVDLKLYEAGSEPRDDLTEGPRDRAYRHFLLWQYGQLGAEVQVLFDPKDINSRLFPRPKALRQVVEELNKDELKEAWFPGNEETLGWVYQFFIEEEKKAAFDKAKKKEKFQKSDIPAATQVFTPRWIVSFLVQNSLGRLWVQMHPDSKLGDSLNYLVPPARELSQGALKPVKDIRLLDPATGTMHFGLVAFDLLVEMYREEVANAGKKGWPSIPSVTKDDDIPAAIVANNLFGIDIDLRAVQLAALALFVRAKSHNKTAKLQESNLACADVAIFRGQHLSKIANEMLLPTGVTRELFRQFCESVDEASLMGSLVRLERHFRNLVARSLRDAVDAYVRSKAQQGIDESYFADETSRGLRLLGLLSRKYDVVFTNPPYMSKGNMNSEMADFLKEHYKCSKGDLYAAFIDRCTELVDDGGRVAMITQQSYMFLPTYEDLREALLAGTAFETVAHLGPRAFPEVSGEVVNTSAFVIRREALQTLRSDSIGVYFRLVKEPDADSKRVAFEQALGKRRTQQTDRRVFAYKQSYFSMIPGSPLAYWISDNLRNLFKTSRKLSEVAKPWVGLQTSDNPRFLRFWWEVGTDRIGRDLPGEEAALSSGKRWFPHMKGGQFQRWYGNQEYVVDWGNNGQAMKQFAEQLKQNVKSPPGNGPLREFPFYFKPGITWTHTTHKGLNARYMPSGFICNVEGMATFPVSQGGLLQVVLGVLNSSFASYITNQLNPTIHYGATEVGNLPWPAGPNSEATTSIASDVGLAVKLARSISECDESTFEFVSPPEWPHGVAESEAIRQQLRQIEERINEEVYRFYEIRHEDRECIETELLEAPGLLEGDDELEADVEDEDGSEAMTIEQLARRWIHYAVGVGLGRFRPGVDRALGRGRFSREQVQNLRSLTNPDGLLVVEEGHPDDVAKRVVQVLNSVHGDGKTEELIQAATGQKSSFRKNLESYLLGEFFKEHVKRYRKRPIYWLLQSPKRFYSVYLFHEKATADTLLLLRGKKYLEGRISRLQADWISRQDQAKSREVAGDKRKARELRNEAESIADWLEDLREFDRHLHSVTNVEIVGSNGKKEVVRWEPELDDGVLLDAAPIRVLLPSWKELKLDRVWTDLAQGKYDWSRTAMRYRPQDVRTACKQNKSYAIALGLA